MKRNTYEVSLFIRKDRIDNNGNTPIYAKITLNKKSTRVSLKIKVNPKEWNSAGFVKGKGKKALDANLYLEQTKSRLYEIYRTLLVTGQEIKLSEIKAGFLGLVKEKEEHTLLSTIKDHNSEMQSLIGVKYSAETLKGYKTIERYIPLFLSSTYSKEDIILEELNYAFILKYEHFLLTSKNCTNNGVMKQVVRLNKILNRAIKLGQLDSNPFKAFKVHYNKFERGFLSMDEVNKLENIDLKTRLEKIRDVFVFQIYTGLAYGDVKILSTENIKIGVDGKDWIFLPRQKTQVVSMMPLLPKAKLILKKYSGKDKSLPVLSNQKMNKGLKEIAKICGIKKNLTTHLARHTFATTITLTNGVPIETVSKMLGHTKLSTTQIYSKIVEEKVAGDMHKLEALLERKKKIKNEDTSD